MKNLLQTLTWLLIASAALATAQAQDKPRNGASQRYEVNQTFDGTSFFKDNNVWIYTKEFADTFGMPAAGIGVIQGAEAAAFRVEDTGYKLCGMGGKAENCMNNSRYILDVYIDERKTPLPWATDQKADWLGTYNSSQWLRLGHTFLDRQSGGVSLPPQGATPNTLATGFRTLRPFMDVRNKKEAFWIDESFHKNSPTKFGSGGQLGVEGFQRSGLAGMTLVSFFVPAALMVVDNGVRYRLVTGDGLYSASHKLFHEIKLPYEFSNAIVQATRQKREQDQQFYRGLFPPPIGTNPNATPFNIK